ncbi:MAG: ATP-binding protein [Planctomycetota bacterium]
MFPRHGLFWKFLLPYVVLGLTAGASLCWVSGLLLEDTLISGLQRGLFTDQLVLGRTFYDTFAQDEPEQIAQFVRNYGAIPGRRITFVRGDGTVVADSRETATRMPNLRDAPAIAEARRDDFGAAIVLLDFDTPADGVRALAVARRVGTREDPTGIVRIIASLEEIDGQVGSFRQSVAIWSTLVGLIGLLLAAWMSQRVSSPIGQLTRAATRPAGRAAVFERVASGGGDELSRLGQALRRMDDAREALITDLRNQNRNLRSSEIRAAAVLDGITEGVVAVDDSETVLSVNQAAVRLLDLQSPEAVVGRPLWEVVRQKAILDAVRDCIEARHQQTQEFRAERGEQTLAVRAGMLPGTPSPGVAVVVHDVTELRRLEQIRTEFVANVHHELKTPLSVISACTETLMNGAADSSAHRERFLSRIASQSDRLAALIGDLLKIARVESTRDVFELDSVDLGEAVEACVDGHAEVAAAKDVFVAAIPPAEAVRVLADVYGLRTIFDNLISNAINYTPGGGTVRVAWSADGPDTAVVEVTDTGIGIPAEHRDRVFERFHRVDAARSREGGGTGLGLAIVKHFVADFGGRIELDSEVGRGSTFRVLLPRS